MGASSCGEWVKESAIESAWEADDSKPFSNKYVVEFSWLVGYLSGIAVSKQQDFLVGTTRESITLWMDSYCQKNPLDDTYDAANVLAKELAKRKR